MDLLQESTSPERLLATLGHLQTAGDRMSAAREEGWHCSLLPASQLILLSDLVVSKRSEGTDTAFCCATTPTALLAHKTEWRK